MNMIDLSEVYPYGSERNESQAMEPSMLDPLMFAGLGAAGSGVVKGIGSGVNAMRGMRTAPSGAIANPGRREATKTLGGAGLVAAAATNPIIQTAKMFGDDAIKAASRFSSKTLGEMKSLYSKNLLAESRMAKEAGHRFIPTKGLDDEFANIVAYQKLMK